MTFEELLTQREQNGRAEGKAEGKAESIIELLKDYGMVPEDLCAKINTEQDPIVVSKWLKLAAKVTSIEEFLSKM